jgi:hypothetical protein
MELEPLMSFTQAVLAQQRHGQPQPLFAALDGITGRLVGHRLFTLLAVTDGGRRVQRVHSSNPSAYPVGGSKEMGPTPWGDLVIRGQQPFLGRDAHDIRWAFPDHALIASLGLASVVNLPVVYDGETIGATAMLHEAGWYRPEHVDLLMPFVALLVPAFLGVGARGVRPPLATPEPQ